MLRHFCSSQLVLVWLKLDRDSIRALGVDCGGANGCLTAKGGRSDQRPLSQVMNTHSPGQNFERSLLGPRASKLGITVRRALRAACARWWTL